jgi:ABC-type branched-subunit amino acid transport system permease subunit
VLFGLGGYTYAVSAINLGETTTAALLAVLLPTLFAAMLGYFLFWGRISDVCLGVITGGTARRLQRHSQYARYLAGQVNRATSLHRRTSSASPRLC